MSLRRRTLGLVAAALALLLATAPLLPDDPEDDPGIGVTPTGARAPAAVARQMRREIDRVVREGQDQPRARGRVGVARLVQQQVRCAELAGQRYCLGQGWVTGSEDRVRQRVSAAVAAATSRGRPVERTGDRGPLAELRRRNGLGPREKAAEERAELEQAAAAVGKVWELRHAVEGVPLPADIAPMTTRTAAADPVRSGADAVATLVGAAEEKTHRDYPQRKRILKPRETTEQVRTYWCGPTTMQMIGWGWNDVRRPQRRWARRLGTTTSGTSITRMVDAVNRYTGYDGTAYAGPYVALDIGDWKFSQWWLLVMRHIEDYRAPLVMHPVLRKEFYSYLDDDASGHFQVGRGYDKRYSKPNLLGFFEPWNQQRFDPSEPFIKRVQWYNAYKQYRANQAHFQHNIGV
jgi:hypothetical protein